MKKIVFASVMALASMGLSVAPAMHAQENSSTIQIKDPAEFNAYQMAITQNDPKAKATALEGFLTSYPNSVVKPAVLDVLIDTYQQTNQPDQTLSAASRLLQVDPNNLKATVISVYVKKSQCGRSIDPKTGKSNDPQTCDDVTALGTKGLALTKPAAVSETDWKAQTDTAFPIFHSGMALAAAAKGDIKGAIDEYKAELNLYTPEQSRTVGLPDELQLADLYTKPSDEKSLVNAVWFYARVWSFAPPQYKAQIEPKLEYYYKKYHGGLDGLDALKQAAQATTFPPTSFKLDPAKSPQEQIHELIASTSDLGTLALADKETVLAVGSKEDADKMWAILQGKATQVPGVIIEATPTQLKVAVTADAKNDKIADFIVNLKTPLTDAEQKIYVPGFEFKTQPAAELDGTYDTYTQIPATETVAQRAEIVLKEGVVIPEKKKAAAPAKKPAAGAAHRKPAK